VEGRALHIRSSVARETTTHRYILIF